MYLNQMIIGHGLVHFHCDFPLKRVSVKWNSQEVAAKLYSNSQISSGLPYTAAYFFLPTKTGSKRMSGPLPPSELPLPCPGVLGGGTGQAELGVSRGSTQREEHRLRSTLELGQGVRAAHLCSRRAIAVAA